MVDFKIKGEGKIMKKSIVLALMALVLCASAFAAGDIIARTEDGRIAILHGDNTYEYFVKNTPEEETGFNVDAGDFLGVDWDSARLVNLGNVLSNGRITLGSFYMLELTVSDDSAVKAERGWNVPVLKLSDGEEARGFGQSLERYYSASSFYKLKTGQQKRTMVYSVLFEVPQGASVSEIGFSKSVSSQETSWISVGSEGALK